MNSNIGKYTIDYNQILGVGSYGKVFALCDRKGSCPYALKIPHLSTSLSENEMNISTKAAELGVGPKVLNGATLRAWDRYQICGMSFVWNPEFKIMERVYPLNQIERKRRQQQQPLSPEIKDDLETKVHRLHLHGIVHCDIAKRNIMIRNNTPTNQQEVVLVDYGLAMYKPSLTNEYDHRQWDKCQKLDLDYIKRSN
jgi:serine/threonine protein kinase